jgi:hypothetical protein
METDKEATLAVALRLALSAISKAAPSSLHRAIDFVASTHDLEVPDDAMDAISVHLKDCGPNDAILDALASAIHTWDHREGSWAGALAPHSDGKRAVILDRLGFDPKQQRIVNERIPRVLSSDLPIVIAEDHEPWYADSRKRATDFYWDHYSKQLIPPNGTWSDPEVRFLDFSTDDVISRLSDPSRRELYPVKGLVMGYVQSGKTSHFNGLIAKAADAGYRLIVVLAGTLDILRKQTQRRIDKDIVGRELLEASEYGNDSEWGSFVTHGGRPSDQGVFDWERLTNSGDDYLSLRRRLSVLEFRLTDRTKAFNHPDNLRLAAAKLIVVKKNPDRLEKLCNDLEGLKELRNRLENVPTLVIDDESDQASINTIDQTKPGKKGVRTSTNKAIGRLLALMPRAQYVGYTATPFANVFVDPEDAEDLFPKDFIISLRRPAEYMGVSDFYDLDEQFEEGDYRGNKNAFVRGVIGDNEVEANLPRAIDSYVLAGAIKLYRSSKDPGAYRFRHHTMLVHHAATQVVHENDKEIVENIFRQGARYQSPAGMNRLRELYETDFAPVSAVRSGGAPTPRTFDELKPFISDCLTRICSGKPVRIVNGEAKRRDETPDFDVAPVWAILVGGTKLSRGYTVEGLTVSYYRRPTGAGDTLMQMGRWFGFRPGYRDLVRLFIGRNEKRGKKFLDLYEAFGAVCRDEEALREDLKKYASEGVKPWQVPPLVRQHLTDLPPTSRNKMFNAKIASKDLAGEWTEKTSAPTSRAHIRENLNSLRGLLRTARLGEPVELSMQTDKGVKRNAAAIAGSVTGEAVLSFLRKYRWAGGRQPIDLEMEYIERQFSAGRLRNWTLLLPQVSGEAAPVDLPGVRQLSAIHRARVSESRFGVYSEPRHRDLAAAISGCTQARTLNPELQALVERGGPVLVAYLIREDDEISVGFGIQYPGAKIDRSIQWTAQRKDKAGQVVVSNLQPARKGVKSE